MDCVDFKHTHILTTDTFLTWHHRHSTGQVTIIHHLTSKSMRGRYTVMLRLPKNTLIKIPYFPNNHYTKTSESNTERS